MDSRKKLTPDETKQLIDALNRYERDPIAYNLRSMLVSIQFVALQQQPFENFELLNGHLQNILCSDYANRTKMITILLYEHTMREYPELFGKFGDSSEETVK